MAWDSVYVSPSLASKSTRVSIYEAPISNSVLELARNIDYRKTFILNI